MGYLFVNRAPIESERSGCDFKSARILFDTFHGFPPPSVIHEPCRRVIPKVLVHVGELRGLIYRSDKGQKGRPQTYIHFMENAPRLACDPAGKQLYIIGGNYKITAHGIEG
ncbi:MAG TPA: hypothetical protein VGD61_15415 [Pyrinomonadaceae bacterium]